MPLFDELPGYCYIHVLVSSETMVIAFRSTSTPCLHINTFQAVIGQVEAQSSEGRTAFSNAFRFAFKKYHQGHFDAVVLDKDIIRQDRNYTLGELRANNGLEVKTNCYDLETHVELDEKLLTEVTIFREDPVFIQIKSQAKESC